jgi:hypothetical protein
MLSPCEGLGRVQRAAELAPWVSGEAHAARWMKKI